MASNFTKRKSKPTAANLEYVRQAKGGWSQCCQGSPTDDQCDSLANCVGYACGRFNEIYNEIMGTSGMRYPYLNCNAENFIERCKKMYPELQFSINPAPGAIICWRKGEAGVNDDGAGHVAIVEEVIDNDTVITSESAYGGTAWYSKTRKRGEDGNWGLAGKYAFRAFILNPAVQEMAIQTVNKDEYKDQVEVKITALRMRREPSLSGSIYGYITPGLYNVLDTKVADGYTWYQLAEGIWIADCDGEDIKEVEFFPRYIWVEPTVEEENNKVNQIFVGNVSLRIRKKDNINSEVMGMCKKNSYYDVYDTSKQEDYMWYKIGDDAWCAGVEEVSYYIANESTSSTDLKDQIKALKLEKSSLESELNSAKEEINSLKKQLSDAQLDNKAQVEKLADAKKQLALAQAKLDSIAKIL